CKMKKAEDVARKKTATNVGVLMNVSKKKEKLIETEKPTTITNTGKEGRLKVMHSYSESTSSFSPEA
ncbi:hypothetical protein HAX54_040082, partial [Datura stramonium]|nr:hypothetical protein [Datura stramonium]